MPINTLFFDAVGTLFALREPVGQTYARLGAEHGWLAEPDHLEAAFRANFQVLGRPAYSFYREADQAEVAWWRELVQATFLSATARASGDIEACFQALFQHYARAEAWQLYPETEEVLEAVSSRYRCFIASNFDKRLPPLLEELGIAHHFQDCLHSSRLGASKPSPAFFEGALLAASARAQDTLHVGDDPKLDQEAATTAGIASVHLMRPQTSLWSVLQALA
ncbi:MAG: HAD-IA family hydrolase [Verrucomicrobiota bacterium]